MSCDALSSPSQEEGQPVWSDGSAHNLTKALTFSLPANQTDCFALQRNASGPGYFLTPFFCNIPLPFICQYQSNSPCQDSRVILLFQAFTVCLVMFHAPGVFTYPHFIVKTQTLRLLLRLPLTWLRCLSSTPSFGGAISLS